MGRGGLLVSTRVDGTDRKFDFPTPLNLVPKNRVVKEVQEGEGGRGHPLFRNCRFQRDRHFEKPLASGHAFPT